MVDLLGLVPVLALFLAFWAVTDIWRSNRALRARVLWVAIASIPFLGFLVWFLAGPRKA